MPKYKLTIAYEGTAYGGWQVQTNTISIQSLIEKALTTALRSPISIVGAGRTDAGVHALGQIAHFSTDETFDPFRLQGSLNGLLPRDIRIVQIEETASDFHARFSAISKEYHYHLHLNKVQDPFKRHFALHVPTPLNLGWLQSAAHYFVGKHDFSAFANESSEYKNPVRTVTRLDISSEPGGIRLEFEGDGFLYKMVRNITGTLLDVAQGKIDPRAIGELLASKDRRKSSAAAPPHGLFLVKVKYPEMPQALENESPETHASGDDRASR